jgi:hypothetical protein
MWEPQLLATLRASTACTGITLPLLPEIKYAASKLQCTVNCKEISKNLTSGKKK